MAEHFAINSNKQRIDRPPVMGTVATSGIASEAGLAGKALASDESTGAEARWRPKRIIDFRAKATTAENMAMFVISEFKEFYGRTPTPQVSTLGDFIKELDGAGISLAVAATRFIERDINKPLTDAIVARSNDYSYECVKSNPDRIVAFGAVEPHLHQGTVKEADRFLGQLGMKGITVDLMGMYADDALLFPIYYKCLEYDVPIVLTCGPRLMPWIDPNAIAKVARELPELKIVCCHAVYPRTDEFIALAYAHRNVFLDTSVYLSKPGAELVLDAAMDLLQDKILYASGYPFAPLDEYRRFEGRGFALDVLDKVMYTNGARLLKIETAEDTVRSDAAGSV